MTGSKVALVGLMGSGKTPLGRSVAQQLGWHFFDSDHELERRFGANAADIAAREGIEALHQREAAILLDVLVMEERAVIAAAASTVDDSECCAALESRAFVVWLRAGIDELVERALDDPGRPLEDDVSAQLTREQRRRDPMFGQLADLVIDTTALEVDGLARHIASAAESALGSAGEALGLRRLGGDPDSVVVGELAAEPSGDAEDRQRDG